MVGALACGSPASPSPFTSVAKGVEYGDFSLSAEARAYVFRIDLTHWKPVLLEAQRPGRTLATVREMAEESGLSLAVNGNFFDEKDRPLGLLISEGEKKNSLRSADWGVFTLRGTVARLVHTRDLSSTEGLDFAIQCGPRVLIAREVPSLKPQIAARTGLGIASDGRLLLLVTHDGPATAREVGAFFRDQLQATDALLLDGGPSTQLFAKFPGFSLLREGGGAVANAVALRAR